MPPTIRRPTPFDVSRLVFVGAVWGASFIFISIALQDFGPVSVAAWRILLAALVLVAISLLSPYRFPNSVGNWLTITAVGFLNSALPFFLISWGQQFISSAEAALLMATGTFFGLFLSHFTHRDERINSARALGVSIGFSGVVVLVFWDLIESGAGALAGQLAVMAAGCSYATSSVLARRISALPPLPVAAGALATSCFYMVPLAFLLEDPRPAAAGRSALLSIVYLGVIATALAFVIRLAIIRDNGAVFTGQVGYLVPLFGVLWSWLYFAGDISLQTGVALLLILAGIAITRRGTRPMENPG